MSTALAYPDLPQLALSIRQPWTHCVVNLGDHCKDIENRDWPTRFRGRIAVHAGKAMTQDEWDSCFFTVRAVAKHKAFPEGLIFPGRADLQFGGIIGSVEIVDCVETSESPWFFGRYGFVLRNPKPHPFIPVKGQLSFFDWRRNLPQETAP